jgi:hypothetical protein
MARGGMRPACWLLASCAVLSSAGWAEAAPLLVDWSAPACALESGFRARVRDALRRDPENVLEQELRVRVQIAEKPESSGYSLEIETEAGRRQLETPSCDEAVAAAATLVALTIDPNALPPPAPAEPPPPPPAQPPQKPRATKPPPAAAPPARVEPYVAAFGGASLGEVPALSPLVGGAIGLRWQGLGVGAEGFWIAPQTELLTGSDKGGEIGLFGGGLSVCYSPLRDRFRLTGCVGGQAGAWSSSGVRVDNPTEQTDWWLAGLGRLGTGVRFTRALGLFVNGDVVVPARTPRFKLEGLGEVFQPSAVAGRFSGGVELGF